MFALKLLQVAFVFCLLLLGMVAAVAIAVGLYWLAIALVLGALNRVTRKLGQGLPMTTVAPPPSSVCAPANKGGQDQP